MSTLAALREEIRANYLPDEDATLKRLVATANLDQSQRSGISKHAADLVRKVRDSSDPRLM